MEYKGRPDVDAQIAWSKIQNGHDGIKIGKRELGEKQEEVGGGKVLSKPLKGVYWIYVSKRG